MSIAGLICIGYAGVALGVLLLILAAELRPATRLIRWVRTRGGRVEPGPAVQVAVSERTGERWARLDDIGDPPRSTWVNRAGDACSWAALRRRHGPLMEFTPDMAPSQYVVPRGTRTVDWPVLRPFYVTAEEFGAGAVAVLRCAQCVGWDCDADGIAMPDLITAARAHLTDAGHTKRRRPPPDQT